MGAFFLYKHHAKLLLDDAKKIFIRKGFSEPKIFILGEWVLWQYRKQLLENLDNFLIEDDGFAVFSCGTVVYRGLGYQDSMRRLLKDFRENRLDQDELLGNFALLFWDGRKISILADRLNVQQLFFNEERSCLSSSFLAVLAASPYPLPLNRLAVYEKFSCGYIVSPDTLVKGIYVYQDQASASFPKTANILFIRNKHNDIEIRFHDNGFEHSLRTQLEILSIYFHNIDKLNSEFKGELGLSSGYDSRLILALTRNLSSPVALHTHYTKGVHESEKRIAEKLASVVRAPILALPTTRMEDHEEKNLSSILCDNLYFFDGRNAHDMGAFSETYTSRYRKSVVQGHGVSYIGLGGEIYRNVYCTPMWHFHFNSWMDCDVFYPFSREAVGSKKLFEATREYIKTKMFGELGSYLDEKMTFFLTRIYYAFLRMPQNAGNVCNAYNQINFCLAPFIELRNSLEAVKATPYVWLGGAYQAALITMASPDLAAIVSHYGHSFDRIPTSMSLKAMFKTAVPMQIRHLRARYYLRHRSNALFDEFVKLRGKSPSLISIFSTLEEIFPNMDFNIPMRHYAQKWTTVFVGTFLKEFREKLSL